MKERDEFVISSGLLTVVVGLAGYLAWTAVENLTGPKLPPPPDGHERDLSEPRHPAPKPFPDRDLFASIVPTPTPAPAVVPPTATPPRRPPPSWWVILIIGDAVQIEDAFGKMHYAKEGESLGGERIVKVDAAGNIILLRNQTDGREVWMPVTDSRAGRGRS